MEWIKIALNTWDLLWALPQLTGDCFSLSNVSSSRRGSFSVENMWRHDEEGQRMRRTRWCPPEVEWFTGRKRAEDDPWRGLFTTPEVRGSAKAGGVLRASKAAVVPVHLAGGNRILHGQQTLKSPHQQSWNDNRRLKLTCTEAVEGAGVSWGVGGAGAAVSLGERAADSESLVVSSKRWWVGKKPSAPTGATGSCSSSASTSRVPGSFQNLLLTLF